MSNSLDEISKVIDSFVVTGGKLITQNTSDIKAIQAELADRETTTGPSLGRLVEPDSLPGETVTTGSGGGGGYVRRPRARTSARVLGPMSRHSDTSGFDHFGDAPIARPRQSARANRVLGPMSRHSDTSGFDHFGDFVMAVRNAGSPGGETDGRLLAAAATTFGNEGSGTDGGFAIPPDFRTAVMEKAAGEDSLLARTMKIPTAGNTLTFPTAMAAPWDSGGIQANWEAEAAAIAQTKPSLQEVNVRLHKLAVLVPVSDELMEDAPAMGVLVSKMAADAIDFKVSDSIVNGSGAGQPLGFRNSPVMISVAEETSQAADTIAAGNIVNMLARLPVQNRANAIWLIHPDAEPQLSLMTIASQPVYMPPGGLRDTPFARLMGRPVIPHQTCQTVGDAGDILLADLSAYLTAVKAGGLRADTSIHLWFDQGLMAFRFILRLAGQPWWSETTASKNGSHTMSPFIQLAERAG